MSDDYRPDLRGDGVNCGICDEPILDGDAVVTRVETAPGVREMVHVVCTKDGVERWNRENRPNRSPLLWERAERPTWTAAGAAREPAVADTRRGYLRRSSSARVRQASERRRAGER